LFPRSRVSRSRRGASGTSGPFHFTTKYLRKFATDEADKRYGLKNRNDQWYLGNSKVDIVDNNIKIGDTEYQGTEGLWHLLMMDKPDKNLSEVKIIKTVEKC